VAYLKEREPEAWSWASSDQGRAEEASALRTGLLKSHYRLDAAAHPELAERCSLVARRLDFALPVTMYQAQGGLGMNASLLYLPGEAHLAFTGPILETLRGAELDAVLAHELAHARLWEIDGGDFLTADRLLVQAAADARAADSHLHTARRLRLYTEIYADRGALAGCADLHGAVAALVKTQTGLTSVSADGYLRQADEIFACGDTKTEGLDHPETFIRARALRLWAQEDPGLDDWLQHVIEGPVQIDELDLPGQRRLEGLTRRFLAELLRPRWFHTPAVLAHARAFFPDFEPGTAPDESLTDHLPTGDGSTRDYWIYLLLDFASVDGGLEDVPLAAAITWARRLEFVEAFERLAVKELGLPRKQLARLKREADDLLARAAAA
jgi:hypothetical protein